MMRKWHRWLVVFFGVFLFWIAGTGVAMQASELFGEDHDEPRAAQVAGSPQAATQPRPEARMDADEDEDAPKAAPAKGSPGEARPERRKDLHHVLMGLHSGETFGPLGTAINVLSGLALLFFSFSGLWMYVQMWRNRAKRNLKPGWFWK